VCLANKLRDFVVIVTATLGSRDQMLKRWHPILVVFCFAEKSKIA